MPSTAPITFNDGFSWFQRLFLMTLQNYRNSALIMFTEAAEGSKEKAQTRNALKLEMSIWAHLGAIVCTGSRNSLSQN
jgi:hypothetical protein